MDCGTIANRGSCGTGRFRKNFLTYLPPAAASRLSLLSLKPTSRHCCFSDVPASCLPETPTPSKCSFSPFHPRHRPMLLQSLDATALLARTVCFSVWADVLPILCLVYTSHRWAPIDRICQHEYSYPMLHLVPPFLCVQTALDTKPQWAEGNVALWTQLASVRFLTLSRMSKITWNMSLLKDSSSLSAEMSKPLLSLYNHE